MVDVERCSDSPDVKEYSQTNNSNWDHQRTEKPALFSVILLLGMLALVGESNLPGYFLFAFIWLWLSKYVILRNLREGVLDRFSKFLFVYCPFSALFAIGYGTYKAEVLLDSAVEKWSVTIKINNNKEELRMVKGMRRFESFSIVVDIDRVIFVIPNSSIVDVKKIGGSPMRKPLMCHVHNVSGFCPAAPNIEAPRSIIYDAKCSKYDLSQPGFNSGLFDPECEWRFFISRPT